MLGRTALQFGGQITFGALLLINSVLISRWLGPDERGRLALLVFVPYFTVFLVNLGFASGVSYYMSRSETTFAAAAGSTIAFGLAVSAAVIGAGALLATLVVKWVYNGLPVDEVLISAAALPPLLVTFCFEPLWVAANRIVAGLSIRLIQGVAYFALAVTLVGGMHLGIRGAIIAYTTGVWIAFAALVAIARREARGLSVSLDVIRRSLAFGAPAHPGSMAEYVLYRISTWLISRLANFTAVGFYAFAQPFAEIIWLLSISIRPVLFAETSRAGASGGWDLTARGVRLTLTASLALSLAILGGAALIVALWLPEFWPSIPVLAVLLLATSSATIFQLLVADLISKGHARLASRVSLLPFVPAMAAYFLLIPPLGAMGAAIASLIAYVLQSAVAIVYYRRVTGAPAAAFLTPTPDDIRLLSERLRSRFASRSL